MTVTVDADICTGCGLCAETCPEVFEMVGDLAVAKAGPVPTALEERCGEAAEGCPVSAIFVDE